MKYRVTFFVGNYPDAFVTDNVGAALNKLAALSQNVAPVTHVTSYRVPEYHEIPA